MIGIDIPGLQCVRDFNAGILIQNLEPESIAMALTEIEKDYEAYVENCFKAAEHFSFDKAVAPLVNDLRSI